MMRASEATPTPEALLRQVLRSGASSLEEEYPLVFDGPGEVVHIERDGATVSGCGVLPRTMQVGSTRLPVGLIGSVATHPDHRGQGHASEVLQLAEQALAESGAVLSLLWAEEPAFYDARGYVPLGTEVDYLLPPEIAPLLPERGNVRSATSEDACAIHALYSAHSTRIERDAEETAKLLASPNMRTLVLEREGVPCAYVCEGRGGDLQGVLHEWGGSALDVLAVVRVHLERLAIPTVLMAPRDAKGLFRYLTVLGLQASVGILGMGKLVSLEAAGRMICEAYPALTSEARPDGLLLRGPGGDALLDDTQTLLLLAAPQGLREVAAAVEELVGVEMPALPLAPFCWGLDSI